MRDNLSESNIISVRDLCKDFENVKVLKGADLPPC